MYGCHSLIWWADQTWYNLDSAQYLGHGYNIIMNEY